MSRCSVMFALVLLVSGALVAQPPDPGVCGCMDVVLLVDDTGSMGGAIDNVKAGLDVIVAIVDVASGDEGIMGVMSFKDDVEVDLPLDNGGLPDVVEAIDALTATGGSGIPEASDETLRYVVTGDTSCPFSGPPLGEFRDGCVKIAVLVTDAPPAGCNDVYTDFVDDTNALMAANDAAEQGILISAVLVDDGDVTSPQHPDGVERDVMSAYAAITGGVYTIVPENGAGTAIAIDQIVAQCGEADPTCPRAINFWRGHPEEWPPTYDPEVGDTLYTLTEILLALNQSPNDNAVVLLSRELIGAELNIANGSDPDVVADEIDEAHALLTGVDILNDFVDVSTPEGEAMVEISRVLREYNFRRLTPDCDIPPALGWLDEFVAGLDR